MSKRRHDRDRVTRRFHYTHLRHLVSILADGVIHPCESNVGSPKPEWPPVGERVGPDVVWVTDLPVVDRPLGLERPDLDREFLRRTGQDKTEARLTLELPRGDVFPWRAWAADAGMHPAWFEVLAALCDESHTYVVERAIPREEWSAVHVRVHGRWVPLSFDAGQHDVLAAYGQ